MSLWDSAGFNTKNLPAPSAWHDPSSQRHSSNKELVSLGQEEGTTSPFQPTLTKHCCTLLMGLQATCIATEEILARTAARRMGYVGNGHMDKWQLLRD